MVTEVGLYMNVIIFVGVGMNLSIIVFYMLKGVTTKMRHYLLKKAQKNLSAKLFRS